MSQSVHEGHVHTNDMPLAGELQESATMHCDSRNAAHETLCMHEETNRRPTLSSSLEAGTHAQQVAKGLQMRRNAVITHQRKTYQRNGSTFKTKSLTMRQQHFYAIRVMAAQSQCAMSIVAHMARLDKSW